MSKTFRPLAEVHPTWLAEGIVARSVNGERMTLAVVDLEPGVKLPEHRHENEQLGFVLTGSMTMRIGEEERELHAGDTYAIPSDALHTAVAGAEGCTAVDVFAPTRADWERLDRLHPSPSTRWP